MGSNILITGAAGYIGGSIVADFLARNTVDAGRLFAAVRTEEQAISLSKLCVHVLQLDLTDKDAVIKSLLAHDIRVVIHTASSINPTMPLNLITALSKQGEVSGIKTSFIHSSGQGAFFTNSRWPTEPFKDTDAVFDTEKALAGSSPIRQTDVAVIEHAEARGVASFIVVPPLVYGKGSGEWNKLSVVLPIYIEASISDRAVWKFSEYPKMSAVHISDLTALYRKILEKVLQEEELPTGRKGYYFALAHDVYMGEVLDHLAIELKARGLIEDSKTKIYPNDEAAAKSLGVPVQFVPLWNSGDNIIAEIPQKMGWKPTWNNDRFLKNVGDEIDAVLELGKAKSSLVNSLFGSAKAL
ncbi:hypothetical protein N7495_005303 [Penicillium taxi]|uniref:uncharacterized protein n=1 Tax=Penicillium taxi TaxID=168475 RepID=UPI0025458469|nr:uncharacterized protein N7495_005303 [Penicillium taxi]KAJ5893612.1 hypothetical protein N7495_005303 [Penicillium taxi]